MHHSSEFDNESGMESFRIDENDEQSSHDEVTFGRIRCCNGAIKTNSFVIR